MIKNRITQAQHLKNFDKEGYQFKADMSDETTWVFTRG
jgi:cytoplasmic iron level regulating protein YaaA (DUF328/UPF0246 family)